MPARPSSAFHTLHVQDGAPEIAPDGIRVTPLARLAGGSFAQFELSPHQVSLAIAHTTVEEIWFVTRGAGQMWRGDDPHQEVVALYPGLCTTITLGTRFQVKAGPLGLTAIAVTIPPWPGDNEAEVVDGPWGEENPTA